MERLCGVKSGQVKRLDRIMVDASRGNGEPVLAEVLPAEKLTISGATYYELVLRIGVGEQWIL